MDGGSLPVSEIDYQPVLNNLWEGFALLQIVRDDAGGGVDFCFVAANEACKAHIGKEKMELVGRTIKELQPDFDPAILARWQDLVYGAPPADFEYTTPVSNRSLRVRAFSVSPEKIAVIFDDATEQRRAERALRESEERYKLLFGSINDMILVHPFHVDLSPEPLVEVNDIACERLGYSREELLKMSVSDIDAPESHSAVVKAVASLRSEGRAVWEGIHRDKTGRRIPVEISNRLFELDGRPMVLATVRDITERRRAEEALRASEERYRLIAENTADAIVTFDLSLHPLYVSPSAEKLLGCSVAEATTCPVDRFLTPESLQKAKNALAAQMALVASAPTRPLKTVLLELELRHRDGSLLWGELSASFLWADDNSPNGILVVLRNVTERKHTEQEKEKLQVQLRQAQKMESIGRLAAGVAHDLNNLLVPILGYTELLIEDHGPQEAGRKELEQIKRAAERARDLTRQLLAFGRKQLFSMKVLDLRSVVVEFEPLLRRSIREDLTITIGLPQGPLMINGDAGQLQQVLMNLAVNAQDAIAGTGAITIGIEKAILDETYASAHPEVKEGRYAVLAVSDTGCGMDQATQSRLFEPFFTTKEEGKGTGLGLSTAFGIVKQHGGHITVYSEPGEGSTFRICLPLHERDDARPPLPRAPGNGEVRGSETVLVVEDNEMVRNLTVTMLSLFGYHVLSAESPQRAVALTEREGARISLVLTDVVMPAVNGKELYKQLAAIVPGLKVLYMSGYTEDAIFQHGVLEDGVSFIQKPFSLEALGRKLREVIG